jgi:SAGA-associated factor 73
MAQPNGARKGTPTFIPAHGSTSMAANTNSALSTAPPASGQPKSSLVDPSILEKALKATDKKPIRIKIKRPAPKQTRPGTWMENKLDGAPEKKETEATSTPESPLVNSVDPDIKAAFPTGKPFEDVVDLVQCKHCKKPVSRHQAARHVKDCLRKKQEKLQKKKEAKEAKDAALRKERNGGVSPDPSVDEPTDGKRGSVAARKTSQAVDGDGSVAKKTGKKRKAEDDGKGPSAKKKKKDDPKTKPNKTKGPVDVEKQCGVVLPNGQQCARSLTCKSHSMGAKRAVPGRSLPYDVLLQQYQKKSQAKQHRTSAWIPLPFLAHTNTCT